MDDVKEFLDALRTDDEGRAKATEAMLNGDMSPEGKERGFEQAESNRHTENMTKIAVVGGLGLAGIAAGTYLYSRHQDAASADSDDDDIHMTNLLD